MKILWGGQEVPMVDEHRLTLGEGAAIERHFRCDLAEAGTTTSTIGVIYVSLRRAGIKVAWDAVENLTVDDLDGILVAEPGEQDETDDGQAPPDPTTPGRPSGS